jgi:putative tricarboxylic transport membrane protein
VVGSWRGVSGPENLGVAQVAFWQALLAAATKTAEWNADLDRHFWTEMYLDGAALHDYLQRERTEMRAVLSGLGLLSGSRFTTDMLLCVSSGVGRVIWREA